MTPEQWHTIRARHYMYGWSCKGCGQAWPCDTDKLMQDKIETDAELSLTLLAIDSMQQRINETIELMKCWAGCAASSPSIPECGICKALCVLTGGETHDRS